MAVWVLIVWLVVGVIGGYLVALTAIGSTLGGLILTVVAAIACAVLIVWSTKFITHPS